MVNKTIKINERRNQMSKFIVTFTPYFKKSVLNELHAVDAGISVEKMFDEGKALILCNLNAGTFIKKLTQSHPIFIKHIMPVQEIGSIRGDLNLDKTTLLDASSNIVKMNGKEKFAVQCRIVTGGSGGLGYSSKDIEVYLGEHYAGMGNVPSFSDNSLINEDVNIISVLINRDRYYMGYSTSTQNLNFHCDEARIFSKTGRQISRAENKLKEALSKFKIKLNGKGIALDIGASPGGWTKVLVDYGYDVVSVDPGELHPSLQNNPKITHLKTRIEKLSFSNYFDIIVDDINTDPQVTAQILLTLADSLKDKGLAVVTLKLPFNASKGIKESCEILSKRFEILAIKSLFHNRQEVTALLRKKSYV
jgi:23S rRNA (cytidine2498-2'-O)-methyltransferase